MLRKRKCKSLKKENNNRKSTSNICYYIQKTICYSRKSNLLRIQSQSYLTNASRLGTYRLFKNMTLTNVKISSSIISLSNLKKTVSRTPLILLKPILEYFEALLKLSHRIILFQFLNNYVCWLFTVYCKIKFLIEPVDLELDVRKIIINFFI